jgi:hypothetical protein
MSEMAQFKIVQCQDRRWELYIKRESEAGYADWYLVAGNLLTRDDAETIMKDIVEKDRFAPDHPIYYNRDGEEIP